MAEKIKLKTGSSYILQEGLLVRNIKKKIVTIRMSLQYSLVNQVLYAMEATITAKSLEWRHTHIRDKI